MKKILFATGAILISCVLISSIYTPSVRAENRDAQAETVAVVDSGYIIRSEGGVIVVYAKGDTSPLMVTDTRVSLLPPEDRKKLETGIEADSRNALYRVLEDYCS